MAPNLERYQFVILNRLCQSSQNMAMPFAILNSVVKYLHPKVMHVLVTHWELSMPKNSMNLYIVWKWKSQWYSMPKEVETISNPKDFRFDSTGKRTHHPRLIVCLYWLGCLSPRGTCHCKPYLLNVLDINSIQILVMRVQNASQKCRNTCCAAISTASTFNQTRCVRTIWKIYSPRVTRHHWKTTSAKSRCPTGTTSKNSNGLSKILPQ